MKKRKNKSQPAAQETTATDLRIIGGAMRGRKLAYHGDAEVTRPMKHRVREAIFNLVGVRAKGKLAIDLFAGTGALGLEAISRGAASALLIERHLPTAAMIQDNIASLELENRTELLRTSAFLWAKRDLPNLGIDTPWLVFVSPPYAFYNDRTGEMICLVESLLTHAPKGSLIVVEADDEFDFALLPGCVREDRHAEGWDVRAYTPAVVGVLETGATTDTPP